MTTWLDGTTSARAASFLEARLARNVVYLEDCGGVADGQTDGSGTDNAAAFVTAAGRLDANRGGVIKLQRGRYNSSHWQCANQGLVIEGTGNPGITSSLARGGTQIISTSTTTWFTHNPSSSGFVTLAPIFRGFHLCPSSAYTTGNGILCLDSEKGYFDEVSVSDYTAGYGIKIDGSALGNGQYWELRKTQGSNCLTGVHLKAAQGCRFFGGYFEGNNTPLVGSKGIYWESGDTGRLYGTVIQGYETGIHIGSLASDYQLFGPRLEYCNIGVRTSSRRTHIYGASFDVSLLGGGGAIAASIAIQLDAGATNCYIHPSDITTIPVANWIVDNSADVTNEFYWNSDTMPRFKPAGKATIPTTGTHAVGEIVWNSAPASAGFIGWVCTNATGSGTWKTFGLIS